MKNISKMTWIIIIASFVILTILIGSTTKFIQKLTYKEVIAVEIDSEQIAKGIELEKESKSTDHFTTYTSYPTTSMEPIDGPIHKWIKEKEDAFIKTTNNNIVDNKNNITANFHQESEVNQLTDYLFSVKLQATYNFDESAENTDVKTFVIDKKNQKIVSNEQIFNQNMFTPKAAFQLLVKNLGHSLDYDEWEPELKDINKLEIYLDKKDVVFYIKDETIKIPMIQLADYFTEEYYNLLISEEMQQEINENQLANEQNKQEEITGHKYVALTFDDGPDPDNTTQILDTLDQYNAKATFFMLGKNVKAYPEIAKNVAERNHEIANHTTTHIDLNTVSEIRIRDEITDSKQLIEYITGKTPKLFRPPYGSYNETVNRIAFETDQAVAMWSVDTNDWKHRNPQITVQQIKNNVRPGSVILMHDIHNETADALPHIMAFLDQEGYEFITMSELLPYIQGEGIGPYFGN